VVRCTVSVAALALLASGAAAEPLSNFNSPDDQPSGGAASAKLPQITVEAQRKDTERRVHEFVSRVAAVSHYESLARWTTPICPLVAGLSRNEGEFVLTRLSEIALSVGAPLASRRCRANFVVLVTPTPAASLKAWVARAHYRHLFGDADPSKIERSLNAPRIRLDVIGGAVCGGKRLCLDLIQSSKIRIKQHLVATNNKDISWDRVGIDSD
jgi:hypothetical protein